MKSLLQAFLICGGFTGLVLFTPVSFVMWRMERGVGGDGKSAMVFMPIGCGAALAVGLWWRHIAKKKEPRRSPGQLTEDGSGASP